MSKLWGVILMVCLISCHGSISEKSLKNINGYWEIDRVVLPDGSQKKYTINETIDYFEIENKKGFRKKVSPQLDGTYLISEQSEEIQIIHEGNVFIIEYTTPYGQWREELKTLSKDCMLLEHENGTQYFYKHHESFNLD